MRALGDSDISIRSVSIAGMIASLWFVYVFATRIGDRIVGLLAMSIMMASGAFRYGYEARPYAVVLAAAAGALLSWQNVIRGRSRKASLCFFAVCLAIADSSHYYSILICLPFAIGELVRARRTRVFDWQLLAAMIAGNAIMVAFVPLLPATRAYQGTYWRGVLAGDVAATYRLFFDSSLASLVPLLAALAIALSWAYARRKDRGPNLPFLLWPEETATLLAFALYPLIVFMLSLTVTHTYGERFALPAILGLSILLARASRILVRSNALLLLMTAVILCSEPLHAIHSIRTGRGRQTAAFSDQAGVFSGIPGARIVMTDVSAYLAALKYGPETVRRRLTLLDVIASPTASSRKSTGQMMVLGVRVGVGLPVSTVAELKQLKSPFFVVCRCAGADLGFLAGGATPTGEGSFMDSPVFVVSTSRTR
jgi:hypothetical protein